MKRKGGGGGNHVVGVKLKVMSVGWQPKERKKKVRYLYRLWKAFAKPIDFTTQSHLSCQN